MTIIVLNSSDRSTGTNVDGRIDIPNNRKLNGTYKASNFIMSNSLYNVNSTNNKIYFTESSTDYTATLLNGSYSASELPAQIKTSMEAVGSETYTIVYNYNTNKIEWSATGNFGFTFLTNTSNSAYKLLGINNTADDSEATSRTSDNAIDLTPNKIIYLSIPEANNKLTLSNGQQSSIYISQSSNFGDIIRADLSTDDIELSFNNKINVSYQLHDESGNNLTNTNGTEWSLVMKLIE